MHPDDQMENNVREHYAAVFRFAMSLTRIEFEAQDLTQQAFYVLATRGHQLRDVSKVRGWLFTTLHRAFLRTRRHQDRWSFLESDESSEAVPAAEPESAFLADSPMVLPALARLDPVYQAAVALYYLEDYTYREIASVLEVPIGTVKSRIARGIAQLRRILLPEHGPVEAVQDQWAIGSTTLPEPFTGS
jgi:RNA polymerase sigma-70 factor, ECF subfamily